MGKRTTRFKRAARDFYRTPAHAVEPLLPHLGAGVKFDEPCCGQYDLVHTLAYNGHFITRASDILQGDDALDITTCWGDMFITNPPWSWGALSPMIRHLSDIAPTWLLLNADLMHNKRMAPHMERCAKVVSIGRVKWFNEKSGMENSAWYFFGDHKTDTIFHGRGIT